MRRLVVLLLSALSAGCAGAGRTEVDPANLPPNYRHVIAAKVRETFFDPSSIRDASISAPIGGVAVTGAVTTICLRANAKNRMGGYTGIKETAFVFRAGELTASDQQHAAMICGSANYEPFPEIDSGAGKAGATR